MNSERSTSIYFESLTLMNLAPAIFFLIKGYPVYYFALGRVFRKLPILASILLHRFQKTNMLVTDYLGLNFEVHKTALEAAEHLYKKIDQQNPKVLKTWCETFRSDKVRIYIKKRLATESCNLIKIYLILSSSAKVETSEVRLVVLDNALNRLVLPWLLQSHPHTQVKVTGLNRTFARHLQGSIDIVSSTVAVLCTLLLLVWHAGFHFRTRLQHFKMSKEILWGINSGRPTRNDDFMVDGRLVLPEDIVFFHRRTTAARLNKPEMLSSSIGNAKAKGHQVVAFDRVPIPLSMIWKAILPRYIIFPLNMCFRSLVGNISHPSTAYANRAATGFLRCTLGWEVFLTTYSPRLNLSQDEPDASHIAETIVMNIHGSRNGGFQWADMTQWRAVTQAYVGYNVYFAWGSLPGKFWEGNWEVDEIIHTGYLWGHVYQTYLAERQEQRKSLLGDDLNRGSIVALLDEKANPDWYTTEKMVYDFYKLGVEILNRRDDTTVIAKPKRLEGVRDFPEILELIAPYVESGRLQVWDMMTAEVTQVMAISDVVLTMVMGSPYLEAACCRRTSFTYAPIGNSSSVIYQQAFGKVVFDNVDILLSKVDQALDNPDEDAWVGIEELRNDVDPYRDMSGIERMRTFINQTSGDSSPDGSTSYDKPENIEEIPEKTVT